MSESPITDEGPTTIAGAGLDRVARSRTRTVIEIATAVTTVARAVAALVRQWC